MDVELRQKWSDALRSDEYTQCSNKLTDGAHGRCCLGVLADVAGLSIESTLTHDGCVISGDQQGYTPIRQLISPSGKEDLRIQFRFTALNDKKHFTFAQIADEIDRGEIFNPEFNQKYDGY